MEKKLEKYKEKIHMSANVANDNSFGASGSNSPTKIGQLDRNSLIL